MDTNARTIKMLADALSADGSRSVAEVVCANVPRVLPVEAVALTLAATPGNHHVLSASDDEARRLEEARARGRSLTGGAAYRLRRRRSSRDLDLFQAMADEGPCIDSIAAGQAVTAWSAADTAERWPAYARASAALGFRRTISLPLRLRGSTLGALNLFGVGGTPLNDDVLDAAQAFAYVSTLAIIHHRLTTSWSTVSGYLQGALNQRITVEVAKGVLIEVASVDAGEAAAMLLKHARDTGQRLGDVAAAVIIGDSERDAVIAGTRPT